MLDRRRPLCARAHSAAAARAEAARAAVDEVKADLAAKAKRLGHVTAALAAMPRPTQSPAAQPEPDPEPGRGRRAKRRARGAQPPAATQDAARPGAGCLDGPVTRVRAAPPRRSATVRAASAVGSPGNDATCRSTGKDPSAPDAEPMPDSTDDNSHGGQSSSSSSGEGLSPRPGARTGDPAGPDPGASVEGCDGAAAAAAGGSAKRAGTRSARRQGAAHARGGTRRTAEGGADWEREVSALTAEEDHLMVTPPPGSCTALRCGLSGRL